MGPWYDTRAGITEAVSKGIAGLRELAEERGKAGYKREERMNEWCVLGLFWLDTCGNWSKLVEGAPRDRIREVRIPDVMTKEEMGEISPRWSAAHERCLPPVVEKCDRCLKGWEMRNIGDYHPPHREESPHRHKSCQELAIIEEEMVMFKDILDKSEISYSSMRAIPNEYYRDSTFFGPWFIVETDLGPLRIGYRKRVINIDWTGTQVNHNGDILFKDQDVTTGRTMVHAWGREKAVEYLRKLFS